MKAYNIHVNQIIVELENQVLFFSYGTLIAKKENNKIYLDIRYWNHSKTTLKYLKIFLNTNKSAKDIKMNNEYIFVDLQE